MHTALKRSRMCLIRDRLLQNALQIQMKTKMTRPITNPDTVAIDSWLTVRGGPTAESNFVWHVRISRQLRFSSRPRWYRTTYSFSPRSAVSHGARDSRLVRWRTYTDFLIEPQLHVLWCQAAFSFCGRGFENTGNVGGGQNQIFFSQRCPLYFVHHFFNDARISAITRFIGSTWPASRAFNPSSKRLYNSIFPVSNS